MFICTEIISQNPEAVGTDLWGEQKKDLRLRRRVLAFTGVVVDLEEEKPREILHAEARAAIQAWFMSIDKWRAAFTSIEERIFLFSGD